MNELLKKMHTWMDGYMNQFVTDDEEVMQGIRIKMTDTATVKKGATTINLWQRNMIAFLVETEVGFIVRDKSKFVVITGNNAA